MAHTLGKFLGWATIGLGLTKVIAPHGARKRAMGVCEVTAGIGILAAARAVKRSRAGAQGDRRIASIMVSKTPEECYRTWRDLERLPVFMRHLMSVRVLDGSRSHWITKPIAGKEYSWDAEVTEDIPHEQIAWRSVEGSEVRTSGRVRFQSARGGKGTIVRVFMTYDLPSSPAGLLLGILPGYDPGMILRRELQRFRQMIETGEIATTEGQSAGRRSGATWLDHLARL